MPKVTFHNRAAPVLRSESRTFLDPDHPESEPLSLTIARPSVLTEAAIQERAGREAERWVPAPGRKVNAHPLLLAAGHPLDYLSATMVNALVVLEAVQVAAPEERYTFDELLDMALRCPGLWKEVSDWANDVMTGEFDAGNSSAAGEDSSSPPPSDSSSPTPESSSKATPLPAP